MVVSAGARRILVVDDDPMVATTVQRVLRPEGYEVDVATKPEEFSGKLRQADYHAVLVDPNISPTGVKWVNSVLAEFPGLCSRLIMATAAAKHGLSVFATLQKPLEFGLLIDTVEACVKK